MRFAVLFAAVLAVTDEPAVVGRHGGVRWSLAEARDLAAHARKIGAAATAVTAPFYFRPAGVKDLVAFLADVAAGAPIEVPHDYYPDDDPSRMPPNRWRSHAHLLYGNWINEIYQTTPFDLRDMERS